MNDTPSRPEASHEEILSALFANMVIQQTNMAMLLLGKVAHPESGKFMRDMEAARMFIDQLEMLEVKTKGNLNRDEEQLMKQALAALRMAYVETVDAPAPKPEGIISPASAPTEKPKEAAPARPLSAPTAESATKPAETASAENTATRTAEPEDSRKKFSKKY